MKLKLTVIILLFNSDFLFSQDFAGKRILTGNLNLRISNSKTEFDNNLPNPQNNYSTNSNNIGFSFLSGRIKQNNTYAAYGFNFGIQSSRYNDSKSLYSYYLGPQIQFGKFIKVFDQFYFAPNTRISAIYGWGNGNDLDTKNLGITASILPLSFVYKLNEKLLFSIAMGSFSLGYSNTRSKTSISTTNTNDLDISGNISNQVGISAFYLFK